MHGRENDKGENSTASTRTELGISGFYGMRDRRERQLDMSLRMTLSFTIERENVVGGKK